MIVYRLCKYNYKNDLSGKGAELSGGRWNSKGVAILYTCDSRALCTTEIAVNAPLGIIPKDYYIVKIEIPDNTAIEEPTNLPNNWRSFPHSDSTKKIGDSFIAENKKMVLKVPSAVVDGDYNYLLNPNHKDYGLIKIISAEPFIFDQRLFKK
jgi:RES domain-containing protein